MNYTETEIKGCYIFQPNIFEDERGHFFESFNKIKFEKMVGIELNFIQDNQAYSTYGTLRGLHFQEGKHAQAKLVRVVSGKVLDVAVDLRKDSITFGQYVSDVLSAENQKQLFVPRGFAHGYVVLSESAIFQYKVDNHYHPQAENGIIFNDAALKIDWKIGINDLIISKKDMELGSFEDLVL